MLRISVRHLEELEKRHAVPVIRAGRRVRYDKHALDHLTDALRVKPPNLTPSRSSLALYGRGYEAVEAAVAAARARRADQKKR